MGRLVEVILQPITYLADKYSYFSLAILMLIPFCVYFCIWVLLGIDNKVLSIIEDIENEPLDKTKTILCRFLRIFAEIIAVITKCVVYGVIIICGGFIGLMMLAYVSPY